MTKYNKVEEDVKTKLDYNKRAAVGQAFNLAVHDAIKNEEENNPKYIYKKFVYYQHLGEIVQGSDLEMILEVVNNKTFEKILKDLEGAFK